jgi:transcription initiation factor TFIIB
MSQQFTSYAASQHIATKASTTTTDNHEATAHPKSQAAATCPECDGEITLEDNELACDGCGLVVSDSAPVDNSPEWRAYTSEERNSRRRVGPGADELHHKKGLATDIGYLSQSDYGNLSSERRNQLRRFRQRNVEAKYGGSGSNIAYCLSETKRMATALGYQRADAEQAARLFRRAHDAGVAVGRSLDALTAATLYMALRIDRKPITLDQIEQVSTANRDAITNLYTVTKRELGLPIPPQHAADYLPQIASAIGASNELQRATKDLLKSVDGTGRLQGKNPSGMAAAALYTLDELTPDGVYSGEGTSLVTQQELADIADVDPATIKKGRDRYREFLCGNDSEGHPTAIEAPVMCPRKKQSDGNTGTHS